MRALLRWLSARLRRRPLDADVRDEFAFHLDTRARALMKTGLSADAARRQARLEFGSPAAYAEQVRDSHGGSALRDFTRDVHIGVRVLRRQWTTTVVIILTLALGIGTSTAVFSTIDAVFLRRLPVADPDRLVLFSDSTNAGSSSGSMPDGAWSLFSSDAAEYLARQASPFEAVASYASSDDSVAVRPADAAGAAATRARAQLVSGNFFDTLGVVPIAGRTLTPADDRPEAPPVALVSETFWRTALHADPDVVGSVVAVNETAFTVVGVTPRQFFGVRVRSTPDLWVPLVRQPEIERREALRLRSDYYWLNLVGRLAPGQVRATAEAAMTDALHRFLTSSAGATPDTDLARRIAATRVDVVDGARGLSSYRNRERQPLLLVFGIVGLLLLIACANVATLLLCRATGRRTEVAVRRALGAGRGRLVRQWLTESLILGLAGALAGVVLANGIAPVLDTFFPAGPVHATLDGGVLAFSAGVSLVASLLVGLAPALYAGRVGELAALRTTGRGTDARRRAFGAGEPLVIAQIAVSLVLVVGATLLARTLFNLEDEPLGFDRDDVLVAQINPRLAGYTPKDVGGLYRRLFETVSGLSGVESATFARFSPFSGHYSAFGATVEGYTPPAGQRLSIETVQVGPDYPRTLGMPLVAGRAIGVDDGPGAMTVAMVNEAFARTFLPASSPLGHHVHLDQDYTIVGVVRDALFHSPRDAVVPFVFVPMLQSTSQMALDCELEVRTHGDAAALATAIRQAVAATDSRVAVTSTTTLRGQVFDTFRPERVMAGFVSVLAGLGLLVAAVGLYGIVSHGVARRTREIGVRLSLGASRGDILALIGRELATRIALGLVLGAGIAVLASRALASQLFGVTATDVPSFLLASAILAGVAMAASMVPAMAALRIQPTVALRAE